MQATTSSGGGCLEAPGCPPRAPAERHSQFNPTQIVCCAADYEVLEVSPAASAMAIKAAFRRKAKVMHPDVNRARDAEEKFKALKTAYEALVDEGERRQYDDQLRRVRRQGARGADGSCRVGCQLQYRLNVSCLCTHICTRMCALCALLHLAGPGGMRARMHAGRQAGHNAAPGLQNLLCNDNRLRWLRKHGHCVCCTSTCQAQVNRSCSTLRGVVFFVPCPARRANVPHRAVLFCVLQKKSGATATTSRSAAPAAAPSYAAASAPQRPAQGRVNYDGYEPCQHGQVDRQAQRMEWALRPACHGRCWRPAVT